MIYLVILAALVVLCMFIHSGDGLGTIVSLVATAVFLGSLFYAVDMGSGDSSECTRTTYTVDEVIVTQSDFLMSYSEGSRQLVVARNAIKVVLVEEDESRELIINEGDGHWNLLGYYGGCDDQARVLFLRPSDLE